MFRKYLRPNVKFSEIFYWNSHFKNMTHDSSKFCFLTDIKGILGKVTIINATHLPDTCYILVVHKYRDNILAVGHDVFLVSIRILITSIIVSKISYFVNIFHI